MLTLRELILTDEVFYYDGALRTSKKYSSSYGFKTSKFAIRSGKIAPSHHDQTQIIQILCKTSGCLHKLDTVRIYN